MLERILDWIVGFGKLQIGFWLLIYTVIIMLLKNKILSLTKSGLDKRIQLTDCEIDLDESGSYPKLSVTQRFANTSEFPLKLCKVEISVEADSRELDKFVYNPPNSTLDFDGGRKITVSETPFRPLNLNCGITCKTTKLNQVIQNYHGKDIKIDVDGIIEFSTVRITKISKRVLKSKHITLKPKQYLVVS